MWCAHVRSGGTAVDLVVSLQADVALLQYPLGLDFSYPVSGNDLLYYESVTFQDG